MIVENRSTPNRECVECGQHTQWECDQCGEAVCEWCDSDDAHTLCGVDDEYTKQDRLEDAPVVGRFFDGQ